MTGLIICPGCGLKLSDQNLEPHAHYNASGECWQLYGELSGYTLMKNDPGFVHQHAVDAYSAQHSGEKARTVTTAFALIGLYLAVERGFTGRQVQQAHMLLAKRRMPWPRLEPPMSRGDLTVGDVMQAAPGDERDAMLLRWAESVWQAWEPAHEWVRGTCNGFLDLGR